MIKTLFIILIVNGWLITACVTKRHAIYEPMQECGDLKNGEILTPIAPINYFTTELNEFNTTDDFAYQFIYIVSPTDDSYGFLIWLKVKDTRSDVAELLIGNPVNKKKVDINNEELLPLIKAVETGGYYRICGDDLQNNTFYFSAMKAGAITKFQYQGINAEIIETDSEHIANTKKLYQALVK